MVIDTRFFLNEINKLVTISVNLPYSISKIASSMVYFIVRLFIFLISKGYFKFFLYFFLTRQELFLFLSWTDQVQW